MRRITWQQRWLLALLTAIALIGWGVEPGIPTGFQPGVSSVAIAQNAVPIQRLNEDQIAALVYAQLPFVPLANEYISQRTNAPATTNTLLSRLLRYHTTVQRRSPAYRLDWKLTLADYLGAHDYMRPDQYPSAESLNINPIAGDQQAIAALTRRQRDQVVQAFVDLYRPAPTPTTAPAPISTPPPPVAPPPGPARPGSAEQLRL